MWWKKIVGENTGIPIFVGSQSATVEGHTEIVHALRLFDGSAEGATLPQRPEIRSIEHGLRPRPIAALGAQPFKHIRDADLPKLYRRWDKQAARLMK